MDYLGILKQAWRIIWRYKTLWLLGFFVGGSGSVGSGGGSGPSYQFDAGSPGAVNSQELVSELRYAAEEAVRWVEQNQAVIFVSIFLLVVLVFVMIVVTIAAEGGLVHEVGEADEERAASALRGWGAGFRLWPRVFVVKLVTGLVGLAFALVFVLPFLLVALGLTGGPGPQEIILVFCGLGILALVGGIALSLVITILQNLAVRAAVLDDRSGMDSLGHAWMLMKTRFKDVALQWLVMLGVGIGFGILVAVLVLVLMVPTIIAFVMGAWPVGLALVLLLSVLVVPVSAYNTFHSAAWTVFYRRLTAEA